MALLPSSRALGACLFMVWDWQQFSYSLWHCIQLWKFRNVALRLISETKRSPSQSCITLHALRHFIITSAYLKFVVAQSPLLNFQHYLNQWFPKKGLGPGGSQTVWHLLYMYLILYATKLVWTITILTDLTWNELNREHWFFKWRKLRVKTCSYQFF